MQLRDAFGKYRRHVQVGAWLIAIMATARWSWPGTPIAMLAILGLVGSYLAIARFGSSNAKPWLFGALGSAILFVILVVLPGLSGGSISFATLTWAAMTLGGYFLIWFYRRTEPS